MWVGSDIYAINDNIIYFFEKADQENYNFDNSEKLMLSQKEWPIKFGWVETNLIQQVNKKITFIKDFFENNCNIPTTTWIINYLENEVSSIEYEISNFKNNVFEEEITEKQKKELELAENYINAVKQLTSFIKENMS